LLDERFANMRPAWTAAATTSSGGNWLLFGPAEGTVPSSIQVSAVVGDLAPGTYTGRIVVSATGVTAQAVEVTFVVEPPPPPRVLTGGVVNSASYVGGGVAPGENISIIGSYLGPRGGVSGAVNQATGILAARLADVVVYIGGIASPLFFVRHDQINAQVPYEIAGQATVDLEVEYRGQKGPPVTLRVLEARPGVHVYGERPARDFPPFNAAAVNEDATHNSPDSPAPQGSVVQLSLTGQGLVSPAAETGKPAAASPASVPQRPVSATIGGIDAEVVSARLAPGEIGVLHVSVRVPNGFFPREGVPVIARVGEAQSQTNVTLAVR
jgi:uncharacterized protein (TIGR03437 family)